jgi:hypothetical protein
MSSSSTPPQITSVVVPGFKQNKNTLRIDYSKPISITQWKFNGKTFSTQSDAVAPITTTKFTTK